MLTLTMPKVAEAQAKKIGHPGRISLRVDFQGAPQGASFLFHTVPVPAMVLSAVNDKSTPTDATTTLLELRRAVSAFVTARGWQVHHTPKHLAMSIAIEAAELMGHFQWRSADEATTYLADAHARQAVADELADVVIYCLSFANAGGLDVNGAVQRKLERKETRFPVPNIQGLIRPRGAKAALHLHPADLLPCGQASRALVAHLANVTPATQQESDRP